MSVLDLPPLDFELPRALEAHEPPESRGLSRDSVRLLVTSLTDNSVRHHAFRDLPALLEAGDVVVANDSATLPAAVRAQRADASPVDVHFSTPVPPPESADHAAAWIVEPRHVAVRSGEVLTLPGGVPLRLLSAFRDSRRLWIAAIDVAVIPYLQRFGRPIAYPYVAGSLPLAVYQTVYANQPGSAEMPSAGRAFSADVLEKICRRGVQFVTLTLNTGVASLEGDERPYPEEYWVPRRTADAVESARADGRPVIAVGTTVVRALESALDAGDGEVKPIHGWTDLVITPRRAIHAVDGLLTGFHEPKASHLAMLEAIAGRRHLELAYQAALAAGYLWHEFGDLHLMLP